MRESVCVYTKFYECHAHVSHEFHGTKKREKKTTTTTAWNETWTHFSPERRYFRCITCRCHCWNCNFRICLIQFAVFGVHMKEQILNVTFSFAVFQRNLFHWFDRSVKSVCDAWTDHPCLLNGVHCCCCWCSSAYFPILIVESWRATVNHDRRWFSLASSRAGKKSEECGKCYFLRVRRRYIFRPSHQQILFYFRFSLT